MNETTPSPARNRAARSAQITIAALGVAALVIAGGYAWVTWPRTPDPGPAAAVPGEYVPWNTDRSLSLGQDAMWTDMNEAMRTKNRELFLSWAEGDAVDQLGNWWDSTTTIGWDVAAISPRTFASEDDGTVPVMLGAQFAFAAHPERGDGNPDADLNLIQGFEYTVTLSPSLESEDPNDPYATDRKIVSIVPANEPNPWDEGALHVVKRDHVVLFGMADESALVEANADTAEQAAVTALEAIRAMGAQVPQDGFVSAITGDEGRFTRWEYGTGTPWEMDVAGYARPALRPDSPEEWLDPTIATGADTSGTLIVMGPKSDDQREKTFVHEFAHALHFTAAPGTFIDPPAAVMEGFARYVEWSTGLSERGYLDPRIKDVVARNGADAFADEALRSAEANLAYDSAGSYYAFVAANGGSPWDLAVRGRTGFGGLVGFAEMSDQYSIARWQEWVAAQ
ncbi:hypothetical protein [Microbacterium sp. P05]|uniref:hypothetical protein n=1 Tax=Microbacterium sp. P05 TaxID=3366948 RepID=UPI003746B118